MKSNVGRGFIVLTISGIVCKILGAFFRLPLTYILGTTGIGVFQLVMSVFSFALVLTSGGITVTLAKIVSFYRAKREYGKIKWNIYLSIVFCTVMSFVLGLIFFFLAKDISSLQQSYATTLSYRFFFPLLLFSSLVALLRGIYQGYENMTPTAVSQIIEQICKFVFGIMFAYIFAKKSTELAVAGAFFGIILSEVLAFAYLFLLKDRLKLRKYKFVQSGREEFYSYLIPSTLTLAIASFVHFFDALLAIERLKISGISQEFATSLFGLQTGVVGAILNFPVIISFALATALFPRISFENASKNDEGAKNVKQSFKALWVSVLPITLGILAVSFPMYKVIYPFFDNATLTYAVRLTAIGAISTICLTVMNFFVSFLQAKGDFSFVLISMIFGGIGKVLCTIFLCANPQIGIYGLPIGNVVFAFTTLVLCLIKLRKSVYVDVDSFFLPLLASFVMLVIVGFFVVATNINVYLKLLVGVLLGGIIYVLMTFPLLKRIYASFKGNKKRGRKIEQKAIL